MKYLFVFYLSLIICLVLGCQKEISCEGCSTSNQPPIPVAGSDNPPVACAGEDQNITLPDHTVLLDGSCSTDPDNDLTNYLWSKISGPTSFDIADTNLAQTYVSNLKEGIYSFQLKVTDKNGLTSVDTVQVFVYIDTDHPIDIYVTGIENGIAKYWKNGQEIVLNSTYPNSTANAIVVVGNDVYVAGADLDKQGQAALATYTNNKAKYWKNGQEVILTAPYGGGAASIAVDGNDVYVAGWDYGGTKMKAIYWKNGQPVYLSDGTTDAKATCIVLDDGNVYVAGDDNGVAKYWKNGQTVSLTNGLMQAEASSITVVGNDIYVSGSEHNGTVMEAKYWKNGEAVTLPVGPGYNAYATSIAIVGSDVYVSGYEVNYSSQVTGKYWKNGKAVSLGSDIYPSSIKVYGGDVFIAGSVDFVGIYWKNGMAVRITKPYDNWGWLTDILLVPR